MSQNEDLMIYLSQGNEITEDDAPKKLGIGRLSARILDIKRKGFPVATERREVKKANGKTARIAVYTMKVPEVRNV